jgi:hypothetical protein
MAVAFGCSADLRNLNGCRAVTAAACDRNLECDPTAFSAAFSSLDACEAAFTAVLDKGPVPSGNDVCGKYTSDCLDEIERAPCGRTTLLAECGVLHTVSPGVGARATRDAGARDAASPGGHSDFTPLTAGPPDVLEVRDHVLVACKAGQGCRSSNGDTYGDDDAAGTSFAVDSLRNVYAVGGADASCFLISPDGQRQSFGTGCDVVFSVPMGAASVGVAFSVLTSAATTLFFVLSPGQTSTDPARSVGKWSATTTGIAEIDGAYVLANGSDVLRCAKGTDETCSPILSLSSTVRIRGAEGKRAGMRFLGSTQDGVFSYDGVSQSTYNDLADCTGDVVSYDDAIACITYDQSVRFNGNLVPGATGVAKIALDDSDLYWVTTNGDYRHATVSALGAHDR